ncbi:FAD-linked oxidoreductase ZEB1 [Lachnellula suecica]|uniref:FAD-linked oxidoreductase ZEB1 n=1 Tax=Lachnellula suecica TaxID=602035 RepID=A0A8T9CCC3_9HELO|nr:FAD-linked oxidoreductase ZEB1 [Lachnellula suecica]
MKFATAIAAVSSAVSIPTVSAASSDCFCFPGDSCWPTDSTWTGLNSTVGGRLIATVPIGSPCHDPTFDATACAALQDSVSEIWHRLYSFLGTELPRETFVEASSGRFPRLSQYHQCPIGIISDNQYSLSSSSSVMAPLFANQSCDPFTAETSACLLGNYVRYAINVTSTDDIIAGVAFATANNIRFVIRNTGHDFLGRSTGAGALSIWTHYLKDIEFTQWSDAYYQGSAVTVGAGVQGYEIIEAAAAEGQVVVGGECPTVGLAGGYTQGGGHSALSTNFGLAADQTLSFDVVTANGTLVTASRSENSDLYWALSGGGGGNYGIVVSMTVKTYPDAMVSGAGLQFAAAYTTQDIFYSVVEEFHTLLPAMIDNGTMVVYYFTDTFFIINPVTAYNKTKEDVEATLAPFVAVLNANSLPFSVSYTQFDTYIEHYDTYMGPLPYGNIGAEEYQFGSRLVSRSVITDNNVDLQAVYRNLTENGVMLVGVSTNVSAPIASSNISNAVLPAWRDTLVHTYLTTAWNSTAPFSAMIHESDLMTEEFVPQLAAVAGSSSYMNEADFKEPDYETTFFGANYDKLLAIKKTWDPTSFFYVTAGVGSDVWSVASDGRMCKA